METRLHRKTPDKSKEVGVLEMSELRVELLEGGKSMGSHVVKEKEQVIVGSAKTADFIVPGKGIAGIHALIRARGAKGISIFDLGSKDGTFVDGQRVVETMLPTGASFCIGGRELRVSLVREQAAIEKTLFWDTRARGNSLLHAMYLSEGRVVESDHIAESRGNIRLNTEWGNVSVKRSSGGIEIQVPKALKAELYSLNGQLIEQREGQSFTISAEQKIRIQGDEAELHIFWTGNDSRVTRTKPEADAYVQWRSYAVSFALFLFIGAGMFLTSHKEVTTEETAFPKTEYSRVTMESSSQGGPAQQEPEQEAAAANSQAPAQAAAKSKPMQAVSQMLSHLLQKPDPAVQMKISANGSQTARSVSVTNSKFNEQAVAGGVSAGNVNTQAVSSGLQSMGGSGAKGLNGFAGKGIAGSGGTGVGAGQGTGNGFSLNLGSDEAEALGGLDKALIAAVVQANIGQIKHCYERQLLVDNSIAGKVVAGWTIDGSGSVIATNIKNTTMNSAPVENCIQAKIKSWKFPQPKGGGKVLVSYPFLFKALN